MRVPKKLVKSHVVVTGAGGYLGRHVVNALIKSGNTVTVVDRKYQTADTRITISDVDIFDTSLDTYVELGKPDSVIHLAWSAGFQHNLPSHIEDIPKHYTFARRMFESGLSQFVGMGSMHEVGYHEGAIDETTPTNPTSAYGIAKNTLRQAVEVLAKQHDVVFQWIRGYYITGDDSRSRSIFGKILEADARGDRQFPFTSGKNKYDFIDVSDLARQIVAVANQKSVIGIINCSSGTAVSLSDRVEQFIKDNNLKIRLLYGAYPDREYDSPAVWGDDTKIRLVTDASDNRQA